MKVSGKEIKSYYMIKKLEEILNILSRDMENTLFKEIKCLKIKITISEIKKYRDEGLPWWRSG